jgi:uncharacterized membrane protein
MGAAVRERVDTGTPPRTRPVERGGPIASLGEALGHFEMGAPMHAIFVHFTIALTGASVAFDALGRLLDVESLADAGWWTLAGAALVTPLTLASGLASRLRMPVEEGEARSFLRAHMALGPAFFGLLVGLAVWRAVLWEAGHYVSLWYLAAAAGVALVMTLQGYLGGELVYRYGAEVVGAYRRLPSDHAATEAPSRPATPGAVEELR